MRHAMFAALLVVVVPGHSAAQSLTARTVRFTSEALAGSQATFAILVPPSYAESNKRYPVVYLLHGGSQNHAAFPSRAWFAKEVVRREMIVIMPHVPQSMYVPLRGSMPFLEFIASDLVPYVDGNYRTVDSHDARAIAGISMGGFGASMAGLTHPELFGHVGAFGGAFTAGRESLIHQAVDRLGNGPAPYFYVACGNEDMVLENSRQFAALLAERNIPHEYREVPGGHAWEVWDPQILAFFDLLTRRPSWPRPQ